MQNGQYAVKADFTGDSNYQASSATTTGSGMLYVTPEYAWGLLGLIACIAAFAIFRKIKSKAKN
jgi:hypothetical protein